MMWNTYFEKAVGNMISEALAVRRHESEADFQQKITLYSEIMLPAT